MNATKNRIIILNTCPCFFCPSGASLSGWRWGKSARCATCRSCSSPSKLAARIRPSLLSNLCRASRTWCSGLSQYTTDPHKDTSQHSYSHLYRYTSVWVCGQTGQTAKLRTVTMAAESQFFSVNTGAVTATVHRRISSRQLWLMISCPRGFVLHGQKRQVDVEEVSFVAFSQPKHFSGDTSEKTRRKKTQKPRNSVH